ncbi:MAG: TauD/TfdA family dioxygenase [Cocleimonas sp.]
MHSYDVFPLPPKQLDTPASWTGQDLARTPDKWITTFSSAEVTELETAAQNYLSLGKDIGEITKEEFPLPTLAAKLSTLKHDLIEGIGFGVLRGLATDKYSQQGSATIFCGIGVHLGNARSQNAAGHILGHVRDIGAKSDDPNARIYQTSERQTFHTDSADVVGLLCLKKAQEGGASLLVSTETIYNEMMLLRPDLAELLFQPISTDRRGEVPEGAKPYFEIPVFNWNQGRLTGIYQRQYIDSAQRFPDAIRLTEQHIEALNLFDSLANEPSLNLSMQLQHGDMQFVHNHSMLHDRTGFLDWPEPENRRHLFRLWLSIEGDRELPESFEQRYGSIKVGNRGGIITKDVTLNAPID